MNKDKNDEINNKENTDEMKEFISDKEETKQVLKNIKISGDEDIPGNEASGFNENSGPVEGKKFQRYPHQRAGINKFRPKQNLFVKKKVCKFCTGFYKQITYKDINALKRFVSDRSKILPRRVTGTCAKHQRKLANEIKNARILALIPFV